MRVARSLWFFFVISREMLQRDCSAFMSSIHLKWAIYIHEEAGFGKDSLSRAHLMTEQCIASHATTTFHNIVWLRLHDACLKAEPNVSDS